MCLGLPAWCVCLASMSRPLSNNPASKYRKYLADGKCLFDRCEPRRDFTPICPSLLPRYIRRFFLSAISYIPQIPSGILLTLVRLYRVHLFTIGISASYMKNTLQPCYNRVTYKSPPVVIMTAGEFESPRHKATEFQARPVCRFQHAVAESGEGDLAKDCPSPKPPQLKRYHILQSLSLVICGLLSYEYWSN